MLPKYLFYFLSATAVIFVLPQLAFCQSTPSRWDDNLMQLKVGDFGVAEESLPNAWKTISSNLLVHSILFTRTDFTTLGHFEASLKNGTVRDWMDALVAAYPRYVWEQDASTKLIWIHPKDLPLNEILPHQVNVTRDEVGLRMQEDVLARLGKHPLAGISVEDSWSSLTLNTFDYPMNLHRGVTTVRDVISACCAANPDISFVLQQAKRSDPVDVQTVFVPDFNLLHGREFASAIWWKTEVDPLQETPPTLSQIQDAMANRSPAIREAARCYIEMNFFNVPIDKLLSSAPLDQKGLWTAIGVFAENVHTYKVTWPDAIKKIRQIFNSKEGPRLLKEAPALCLLAGLEMYRVAADHSILDAVLKADLVGLELSNVRDDITRLIHEYNEADRTQIFKELPFLSVLVSPVPYFELSEASP